MGGLSQVEKDLLASVKHTGAAELLAVGPPGADAAAPQLPVTGIRLPAPGTAGQEHAIDLNGTFPFGDVAPARSTRVVNTTSKQPRGPYHPIDCCDRFMAYPLSKNGAGRVRS